MKREIQVQLTIKGKRTSVSFFFLLSDAGVV
jgi:hypothetical protein